MKSFKTFNESLSPVVYHFTDPENAISILRNKQFELSASFGSDDDKFPHRYYLSVAYAVKERNMKNAMFVLDGRKLNEKHKGEQYVYWSGFWTKSEHPNDEAEERVLSNEPYLKMEDPKDYVKEIHLYYWKYVNYDDVKDLEYWSKEYQDFEMWMKYFGRPYHTISEIALSYGIPVYKYKDKAAFMQRNKAKAVESNAHKFVDHDSREYNSAASTGLKYLKKIERGVPISKEEWHNRPRRFFSDYPNELKTILSGYMSSYNKSKGSDTYGNDREITHTIMNIMRKNKLKDLNALVFFINDMIKKAYGI